MVSLFAAAVVAIGWQRSAWAASGMCRSRLWYIFMLKVEEFLKLYGKLYYYPCLNKITV